MATAKAQALRAELAAATARGDQARAGELHYQVNLENTVEDQDRAARAAAAERAKYPTTAESEAKLRDVSRHFPGASPELVARAVGLPVPPPPPNPHRAEYERLQRVNPLAAATYADRYGGSIWPDPDPPRAA